MQHSLKDLCIHRFANAREALSASHRNLNHDIKTSLNRSYYAILYATRALFAADRLDARSHKGLFVVLNKEYIKTGIFREELSDILKEASMIRDRSDYQDFYIVSKEEARQQIENAKKYLSEIANYLETKLNISLK